MHGEKPRKKVLAYGKNIPAREMLTKTIALFTVTFSHLHYNVFERGCEAISGNFVVSALDA